MHDRRTHAAAKTGAACMCTPGYVLRYSSASKSDSRCQNRLHARALGSGTYSSASRSNSVAYASQRPTRFVAPLFASM